MYEVNWSERGHSPDHKAHVFEQYFEALKFLQDELYWQGFDGPKAVSLDVTKALDKLNAAQIDQEFTLRIGRNVYWLVKLEPGSSNWTLPKI